MFSQVISVVGREENDGVVAEEGEACEKENRIKWTNADDLVLRRIKSSKRSKIVEAVQQDKQIQRLVEKKKCSISQMATRIKFKKV